MNLPGKGLAVYVHIPFCLSKCAYCDFLSFQGDRTTIASYLQCLLGEIELYRPLMNSREAKTIYFGGGTPSLLPSRDLGTLLRSLPPHALEITLEANPGTVSQSKLEDLRGYGFNRLSLGIQSFLDRELELLGRIHNSQTGERALKMGRGAGFENINCDLIFGIPGQRSGDFLISLERLLSHRPEHISLYCLSLSKKTRLGMMIQAGIISPQPEDETAEIYEKASRLLQEEGYEHYEISNFARPGKRSQHNQCYWHGQDYLGLGLGAVSFLDGLRVQNLRNLSRYLKRMERKELPVARTLKKKGLKALEEEAILHLRTSEGFQESELVRKYRRSFPVFKKRLCSLQESGLLKKEGERWRLPEEYFLISNEVFLRLL